MTSPSDKVKRAIPADRIERLLQLVGKACRDAAVNEDERSYELWTAVRRELQDAPEVTAPSAERAQEPRGTFACSVCGQDTPHWHDIDTVNAERVIERVVRPSFEKAYTELAWAFPDVRVSGWGWGFQRRQEKDAPDPVAHPSIIPGWYDRWPDDSTAPAKGEYKNPVIQALWRLWLRGGERVVTPSSARPQEEHTFVADLWRRPFDTWTAAEKIRLLKLADSAIPSATSPSNADAARWRYGVDHGFPSHHRQMHPEVKPLGWRMPSQNPPDGTTFFPENYPYHATAEDAIDAEMAATDRGTR